LRLSSAFERNPVRAIFEPVEKTRYLYPRKIKSQSTHAPASAATEGHNLASHRTGSAKIATHDAAPTFIAKPKTLIDKNRPARIVVSPNCQSATC